MGRGKLLLAEPSSRSFVGQGGDRSVSKEEEQLVSIRLSDLKIDPRALRIVTEDNDTTTTSSPSSATSGFSLSVTREGERADQSSESTTAPSPTAASTHDSSPPSSQSQGNPSPNRRHKCPSCKRSRSYWCGDCQRAIGSPEALAYVPRVELPLTFHIIRHPKEKVMKSSAIPLSILAPHQVYIHYFPDIPSSLSSSDQRYASPNGEKTPPHHLSHSEESPSSAFYLLVPGEDSQPLEEIENWGRVAGFVLLDCTWFQVHGMCQHPGIRRLPKVALKGRYTSIFWRQHIHNSPYFLSTAECVYFVLRVYDEAVVSGRIATRHRERKTLMKEENQQDATIQTKGLRQGEEELKGQGFTDDDDDQLALDCSRSAGGVLDGEVETSEPSHLTAYDGKYDNILFYFVLCYQIILKDQRKRLQERKELTAQEIKQKKPERLQPRGKVHRAAA